MEIGIGIKILAFIFFGIFITVGIWLFKMGFKDFLENRYIRRNGKTAEGIVISVEKSESYDRETQYISYYNTPTIEFITAHGELITYTPLRSTKFKYKVGDRVEIIYLPCNPKEARVNIPKIIYGSSKALMIFGGFFIIIPLAMLLKTIL